MECCKQENLEVIEQREDLMVYRCQVCSRRHFELSLDNAEIPWTTN